MGAGIMLTNQHIREVTLFPKVVPVDFTTPPPFSAPLQTGNWTASPASVDPDGLAHLVTGVRFVTDGAGLQPGDVASFNFAMQGPSADRQYTMYAFDATTAQFQEYHLDFRPTLSMSGSAGAVQLSWPATETGFTLERTVDLATPHWLPVPQA